MTNLTHIIKYQHTVKSRSVGLGLISENVEAVGVGYGVLIVFGGFYLGWPAALICLIAGAVDILNVTDKDAEPSEPVEVFRLGGDSQGTPVLPPAAQSQTLPPVSAPVAASPGSDTRLGRNWSERFATATGSQMPQQTTAQEPEPISVQAVTAPPSTPTYGPSPWGNDLNKPKSLPEQAPTAVPMLPKVRQEPEDSPPVAPSLAREMTTPDDGGFYKSWLITAEPSTGKGCLLVSSLLEAKRAMPGVTLLGIDPKNDPTESHRWSLFEVNKIIRFEAANPATDLDATVKQIEGLVSTVFTTEGPVVLVVDELKILMDLLKRAGKGRKAWFSAIISGIAGQGRSRQRYCWCATTAMGVGANGFSSLDDMYAFTRAYLVTPGGVTMTTTHKSYGLNSSISSRVFGASGRAYITSTNNVWQPLTSAYKEIDQELKEAQDQLLAMADTATEVAKTELPSTPREADSPPASDEPTQAECEKLARFVNTIILQENAIALTLEQLVTHNPALAKLVGTEEGLATVLAVLEKSHELGLVDYSNASGQPACYRLRAAKAAI